MELFKSAPVTDYQSMLSRIFCWTALWATVSVWLLRTNVPWLNDLTKFLDDVEIKIGPIEPVKFAGYLVPGLAIAYVAWFFKLHDRLSDLFKIRERFDVDQILRPLAEGSGVPVGTINLDTLRRHRRKLMNSVFYSYASSRDPKIDKHLTIEALDWWSRYWIIIELLAVFVPTSIALCLVGAWRPGLILVGVCVVASLLLPVFRSHCKRYAEAEVNEILRDEARKVAIKNEFSAL